MRHNPKIIISIIIYIFLLSLYGAFFLPSSDGKISVKQVGMDEEGNVYLARTGNWALWLIKAEVGGGREIIRCSTFPVVSEETAVSLFCDEGVLYVQQSWYRQGRQFIKVSCLEKDRDSLTKVWEKEVEEDVDLCDFQVKKGIIFTTGIKCRSEEIFLYSNEEDKERVVKLEVGIPVQACYTPSGIMALTESQELYCFDNEKAGKMYLKNGVYLQAGGKGFFLQKYWEQRLNYYDGSGHLLFQFPLKNYLRNVQMDKRREHIAVLSNDGERDRLYVYHKNQEKTGGFIELDISPGEICKELFLSFGAVTVIYVLVVILVYSLIDKIRKKKKIQYQMLFTLSFVSLCWVLITFVVFWKFETDRVVEQLNFNAGICNEVQKERLLRVFKPEFFYMDAYLGSFWQGEVENALSNEDVLDAWGQPFIHTEVIVREGGEYYAVFSEERAFGTNLANVYQKNAFHDTCILCDEYEREGKRTEFLLYWNGNAYASSISPVPGKEGMYILTKFPVMDLDEKVAEAMKYPILLGMAGWLFLFLFFFTYLRIKWRPSRVLVSQMDKISRGIT